MSTSNDMPAPASAIGSTPRRGDGVAAPRSTVNIELVCVKGERNSVASSHGQMFWRGKLLIKMDVRAKDFGIEWRVKWAQRGLGTFSFLYCVL